MGFPLEEYLFKKSFNDKDDISFGGDKVDCACLLFILIDRKLRILRWSKQNGEEELFFSVQCHMIIFCVFGFFLSNFSQYVV